MKNIKTERNIDLTDSCSNGSLNLYLGGALF